MSQKNSAISASTSTSAIHFQSTAPLLALLGNPNCGKTALFNRLTGSRQKVANYAGVTVERKEGALTSASGKKIRVLDLPGTYSFYPRSPDEKIACDVLLGQAKGEQRPNLVACIIDATNLRKGLRLALSAQRLGLPCVLVLNMMDVAKKQGLKINTQRLSQLLNMRIVETIATETQGADQLVALLDDSALWQSASPLQQSAQNAQESDHLRIQSILKELNLADNAPRDVADKIDDIVLHPIYGSIILAALLFLIFQSVFSFAEAPMGLIEQGAEYLSGLVNSYIPEGVIQSFLADGLIAGLGGVIVFLPQILILFFFILILEESGYLPRAAFLLDRLMGSVGLSGRSFIPLLSSFACAIPGIMATRSIAHPRDRLITILLAPLMTCSARLPVYALLIGAFVPRQSLFGFIQLQGFVLFVLYFSGIFSAMAIAYIFKRFSTGKMPRPLMMELPRYHLPRALNILLGLYQRGKIFLRRVGTIILALTIGLWFFSSYPKVPENSDISQIEYSLVGRLGKIITPIFEPLGFNWQISVSLIPGMAAREVMVSSLATVYALSANESDNENAENIVENATNEPKNTTDENVASIEIEKIEEKVETEEEAEAEEDDEIGRLKPLLAKSWGLSTAFSLLAWFVFAPMCLATLATIRRETGNYSVVTFTTTYLFALAYFFAWITFNVSRWFGLS